MSMQVDLPDEPLEEIATKLWRAGYVLVSKQGRFRLVAIPEYLKPEVPKLTNAVPLRSWLPAFLRRQPD